MVRISPTSLSFALALCCAAAQAQTNVTITVNHSSPRANPIPTDFAGMSFEMDAVRFDYTGGTDVHRGWLEGRTGPFNTLLKTIGVKSVRIGGGFAEDGALGYPTYLDCTHVNDFVTNIGANLIWTLPVKDKRYNVKTYTDYANFMITNKIDKNQTFETVFEIGNEPDVKQQVALTSADYQTRFGAYLTSLVANVPGTVLLGGPSTAYAPSWVTNFVHDTSVTSSRSNIGNVFFHRYVEGDGPSFTTPDAAIDKLLDAHNDVLFGYIWTVDGFGKTVADAGFKPRLEETNSMSAGGAVGGSDAYAAALWGLDYISYLATQTGFAGINFHEGNSPGPGRGGAYNPIDSVGIQDTYTLRGIGYALLGFKQFGQGKPLPVSLSTQPSGTPLPNMTAYSVLQNDGSEAVVLINRTHSSSTATAIDVTANIISGNNYGHAQVMYMTAPNNDPASLTGITLGGQGVAGSGTWSGGYTTTSTIANGRYTVSLPATTAAIVRFY